MQNLLSYLSFWSSIYIWLAELNSLDPAIESALKMINIHGYWEVTAMELHASCWHLGSKVDCLLQTFVVLQWPKGGVPLGP